MCTGKVSARELPPIRAGLFELDPPTLVASRCRACGALSFPSKSFCPLCGNDAMDTGVPLSRQGTVYSYTVIRQAPGGRSTPYVLAYVDLPGSVRLLTQVDCDPASMLMGMSVELDIRPVEDMAGALSRLGYVFRPVGSSGV